MAAYRYLIDFSFACAGFIDLVITDFNRVFSQQSSRICNGLSFEQYRDPRFCRALSVTQVDAIQPTGQSVGRSVRSRKALAGLAAKALIVFALRWESVLNIGGNFNCIGVEILTMNSTSILTTFCHRATARKVADDKT